MKIFIEILFKSIILLAPPLTSIVAHLEESGCADTRLCLNHLLRRLLNCFAPEDREVVEAMDAEADVGQVGRAVRV